MHPRAYKPSDPSTWPPLLTAEELADILGCSSRTIWRRIREGVLPPAHLAVGRKLRRWSADAVRQWLADRGACLSQPQALPVPLPSPRPLVVRSGGRAAT